MRAATTTSDARSSQQALALFFPSSSTMTVQDVIRLLFLLNLQYRKHKQVIPAPAALTRPRTLSKQLYYGSTRCDSPFASCPIA
jgi:hypothetical protein